ncbi:MAG: lipase family protein [Bacillota bacterium]
MGSAKNSVRGYQITYVSINHSGKEIPVSGMILVPELPVQQRAPLLVYQHATIFKNSAAPSFLDYSNQGKALLSTFATRGYIVALADYVGMGQITDYPVEYLYAASEAANGVDIIPATEQLLTKLGRTTNGQLFLSGYSAGGQAASAMGRLIQNSYPEYNITAMALMEGPYDMTAEMEYLLKPGGVEIGGLAAGSVIGAKAIYSYKNIYQWGSLSDIFKEPYAQCVQKDFSELNPNILLDSLDFKADTALMLQPAFIDSIRIGAAARDVAENNTDDWIPAMPLYLLTSKADVLIPAQITEKTYSKMKESGGNVHLVYIPFLFDHSKNFMPSIVASWKIFSRFSLK